MAFLKGYGPELLEEAVAEKADWVDYKMECFPPEIRGKTAKTFGFYTYPASGYRQSMTMFFIKENGQWRTSDTTGNKWKDSPLTQFQGPSVAAQAIAVYEVQE